MKFKWFGKKPLWDNIKPPEIPFQGLSADVNLALVSGETGQVHINIQKGNLVASAAIPAEAAWAVFRILRRAGV